MFQTLKQNPKMISKRVPLLKQTRKKNFLVRLYLDGFQEIHKASTNREKLFWLIIIILTYASSIYLACLTVYRYNVGKKIATLKEKSFHGDFIPQITLCHAADWNKTYFEENVHIPEKILQQANRLQITESQLLAKFAQYVRHYTISYDYEFKPEVWLLLTELFEYNFKNVQFSDFVADAGFRAKELINNCKLMDFRYPCPAVPMVMDMPSCYILSVVRLFNGIWAPYAFADSTKKSRLTFETTLQKRHIFNDSEQETGIRITLGRPPSPFRPHLHIPGNTHAIVKFETTFTQTSSNCVEEKTDFPLLVLNKTGVGGYSRFTCLADRLEFEAMTRCGCHFVAGGLHPTNDEVCTPRLWKECLHVALANESFELSSLMRQCKPTCSENTAALSVTYYNIEGTDDLIRNVFTIVPQNDSMWSLLKEEDFNNIYTVFADVGGVIGVYTGISGAALVHCLALIAKVCLALLNQKMLKPFLGRFLENKLPFAITSDSMKKRQKRSRVYTSVIKVTRSRSIRVHPLVTEM